MPSATRSLQQSYLLRSHRRRRPHHAAGRRARHVDVPQGTSLPSSLTLGQSTERDWSTVRAATDDGRKQILTLHAWSNARGKKQTHDIIGAIRTALHDQPLTLTGHRLVNLRHEFSEARRDPDGETIHGIARFRAVTEPA